MNVVSIQKDYNRFVLVVDFDPDFLLIVANAVVMYPFVVMMVIYITIIVRY